MAKEVQPRARHYSGDGKVVVATTFCEEEGTKGSSISPAWSSTSRTCYALAMRKKGGANTEREGSPAMAEHAPWQSRSEELTSVEVESMGAPRFTRNSGTGTRWMQLGGARCGAGHGGGLMGQWLATVAMRVPVLQGREQRKKWER
jgi:hypothetical protein